MLAWILNLGFAASPPGLVTVPDVTGETQAQATTDITALGLTVSVSTAYSSIVAAGLVISQVPAGGSQVGPGSNVAIVVSLGPQPANAVVDAGRSRRRRLFVQIDGKDFEVESAQHAQALLDQAKALARQVALQQAEARLTVHLATNPRVRPKIERPRIVTHNPELHLIVAQTRRTISNVYKAAYRDAEIALRLAAQMRDDESDDEDLMMLL